MKRNVVQSGVLAFTTAMAFSGAALAQDEPAPAPAPEPAPAPAPAPATAEAGGSASFGAGASGTGGMTLPGAAPAAATAGDSSHDQMIGRVAVGFLGFRSLSVATGSAFGGTAPLTTVDAPVVGIRYWVDEMLGIDAGLGIGVYGSSVETDDGAGGGGDIPQMNTNAFILHGGVPLSLASSGNFSFQIVPEMNVGFGSASQDAPPGIDAEFSGSGFHLDIGARAGAEVHFGFIGIPELSLQGSVGLLFQMESWKGETDGGGVTQSAEGSSTQFRTTYGNDPWDIFTSSISALYYL